MKYIRIQAFLLAIALMLSHGAWALAETAAGDASETAAGKDHLTIVMYDCGLTLYGRQPFGNSIVTAGGDPDGVLLSLMEAIMPAFMPGDDDCLICGYHSDSIGLGNRPVKIADETALAAQFSALRELPENGRRSSNLVAALEDLSAAISENGWDARYEMRLILLTGGAINFATDVDADVSHVARAVDALRGQEVIIHAFGFDLQNSWRAKTDSALFASRALRPELFAPGEYTQAADDVCSYGVQVANQLAALNGFMAGSLSPLDRTDANPNSLYLTWDANALRFGIRGASDSWDNLAGTDSLIVWTYARDSLEEKAARAVEAVGKRLDADGDGALDASPLIIDGRGDGEAALDCPELDAALVEVAPDDEDIVAVGTDAGRITLRAKADGETLINIVSREHPEQCVSLRAAVEDYRLTWLTAREADFAIVPSCTAVVGADHGLGVQVERRVGQSGWQALPAGGDAVDWSIGDGGTMTMTVKDEGEYRITARTRRDDVILNEEQWIFIARYRLDDLAPVSLKTPCLKEQAGQRVRATADGAPVRLENFRLAVEPAELADVFLTEDGYTAYIVPRKAGKGRIELIDETGALRKNAELRISGLTANPLFWLLALAAPLCLIGLTATVVMLIARRRGR